MHTVGFNSFIHLFTPRVSSQSDIFCMLIEPALKIGALYLNVRCCLPLLSLPNPKASTGLGSKTAAGKESDRFAAIPSY